MANTPEYKCDVLKEIFSPLNKSFSSSPYFGTATRIMKQTGSLNFVSFCINIGKKQKSLRYLMDRENKQEKES